MKQSLDEIAIRFASDKASTHHGYCKVYEQFFAPLRDARITLFELGIGGYEYPDRGGASLKTWSHYFSLAKIIGIDVYEKVGLENNRVTVYKGSQDDAEFLTSVMTTQGVPDIVIDDASHINHLSIRSFEILFPWLAPGGLYIVEDIESAWCPANGWASGCADPNNLQAPTIMNFLRKLTNEPNEKYIGNYKRTYEIEAIYFYRNIVVIQKQNYDHVLKAWK